MSNKCFLSPLWYQGTTLLERRATLNTIRNEWPDLQSSLFPNLSVDKNLADKRIQNWRSQPPFTNDSYFAQRLAIDGMTEDEFRSLLGEPTESVRNRFPVAPLWLADLSEAFSHAVATDAASPPDAPPDKKSAGFLSAIEPLINQGRHRLREGLQTLLRTSSCHPFDPDTIEEVLSENLPKQLLMMLSRTLVLELNVARLQGLLVGDTAEARFQNFTQRLRERETMLAILQEYPTLARQLTISINHWVSYSLEFLNHLCADWEAVRATFNLDQNPDELVALDTGAGDGHRSGRSVIIAKFKSGFQLIYKPKSLAVGLHFQELLAWLNERGDHPPFRTLKIIDRGTYGWVEFVEVEACGSEEEVQRFYQRQGGYLALLYALQATDFHFENLIAAGEHPVLVDLEALFHPHIGNAEITEANQIAGKSLYDSVLAIGLLPQRIWANGDSDGIDISGLGAPAGQLTPFGVPHWEGAGTDEMHLTRKRTEIPGKPNRPTLNQREVNVVDYAESIATGFTAIYRLLIKHRDRLLEEGGPLACFAEDEVRVILRSTRTYGLLLFEGFHPDVLRNSLDRDRLFDRLWVGIEHNPHLAKIIPFEREDLWNNDIPIFTTRPNSRDLTPSPGVRLADFFDQSGLDLVRQRIRQLNDEDCAKQLWFIRASLTTLVMGGENAGHVGHRFSEPQIVADRERLLAAARAVGDRLETLALRGNGDAAWIGLTYTAKNQWSLLPLGLDLYNGLPGVVLFLAYLGAITKEARYTDLAQAALTTVRRQIKQDQSYTTAIGGFSGWGGVIYSLTHLGILWGQSAFFSEAEEIVERLPNLIEQDNLCDIVGGSAGCIGSLLSLYRCAPSDRTLAAAVQCGDRLLARAQKMERGLGWVPQVGGTKPLAGYSHGAAGVAWALLELNTLTGDERFRTGALGAIEYERGIFSPGEGNWPDLRDYEPSVREKNSDPEKEIFMTAWCHGAPGIGLSRLRLLRHLDDQEIRTEIDIALRTTLEQGFGSNHSLCHGDLGNLELILEAGSILNDPWYGTQASRLAAMILESIDEHGWSCGIPLGVESPGLMTGLAGIGYELLRLAEPARIPSVLILEPPPLSA